jgi:hypothetical protein
MVASSLVVEPLVLGLVAQLVSRLAALPQALEAFQARWKLVVGGIQQEEYSSLPLYPRSTSDS